MIRTNENKVEKTRVSKERRLAKKLKEMERKRLKSNIDKYHYEIKENNIIKVTGGI